MHGTLGLEIAGHEVKRIDAPDRAGELAVLLQPLFDGSYGGFAGSCQSEVGDERSQFERHPGGEQAVVHLLAELMQVRVTGDARPRDGGMSARWESARALHAEKKRLHTHTVQSVFDSLSRGFGYVANKAQGDMQLLRGRPASARDVADL
jgi:hypothetical protein